MNVLMRLFQILSEGMTLGTACRGEAEVYEPPFDLCGSVGL